LLLLLLLLLPLLPLCNSDVLQILKSFSFPGKSEPPPFLS